MTIAVILVGAIVAIFFVVEVVLRLIARRERIYFDNLPPADQREYQGRMYKLQQMG